MTTAGIYKAATEGGATHLPEEGYFIVLVYNVGWIAQVAISVGLKKMFLRSGYTSLVGETWVQL